MKKYGNKPVIVDTNSSWIYIGSVISEDDVFITLESADAFDVSETSLSKHEYLIMTKQDGFAPNRKSVKIFKTQAVAVTLLEDILEK